MSSYPWLCFLVISFVGNAQGVGIEPRDVLVAVTARIYQSEGRSYEQVYVLKGGGGFRKQLTHSPTRKSPPALRRDGRQVAYIEYREEGKREVCVLEVCDAREVARVSISDDNKSGELEWRVDGTLWVMWGEYGERVDLSNNNTIGVLEEETFECGKMVFILESHRCVSPDRKSELIFDIGPDSEESGAEYTGRLRKGGKSFTFVRSGEGPRWADLIEHVWSPDDSKILLVLGEHGASSWHTNAYVLDTNSGQLELLVQEGDDVRWVGGDKMAISIVGNNQTREFQESSPRRTIQVWANDLYLFDLRSGSKILLIKETSLTRGYDCVP